MMVGTQLPMDPLLKNVEYLGVDLDQLLTLGSSQQAGLLRWSQAEYHEALS